MYVLNLCVHVWFHVKFRLNFTPNHSRTHDLRWIYDHPNKPNYERTSISYCMR